MSDLREKVRNAILLAHDAAPDGQEPNAMADAAIAVCMEEAAKMADHKADEENREWLDSAMSNEDAWVRGGMAIEIAAALRALRGEGGLDG